MKREAGALRGSIREQGRRCPRNGKQAKERHYATVLRHGKAPPQGPYPLASPETGLKGVAMALRRVMPGRPGCSFSALPPFLREALRCAMLLLSRGCARRKKPMVLCRLSESREDPRFEPPRSTRPSDAEHGGNGGANARGGQAWKPLRPLDRALTVTAIIGLSVGGGPAVADDRGEIKELHETVRQLQRQIDELRKTLPTPSEREERFRDEVRSSGRR
jgi:hypothetical protein